MATANTPESTVGNKEQILDEWKKRLSDLIELVNTWSTEMGWSTKRIEKKMRDSLVGGYQAPALLMQEGTIRIILEPIARSAPGADGVVDLYLLPAYDDIASLYYYSDGWKIHYPFPGDPVVAAIEEIEPKPLSREVLNAVLSEMSRNAA